MGIRSCKCTRENRRAGTASLYTKFGWGARQRLTIGSYAIVSETSTAEEMGRESSNKTDGQKKHAKREKREKRGVYQTTLHTEMQVSTIMYLFHKNSLVYGVHLSAFLYQFLKRTGTQRKK